MRLVMATLNLSFGIIIGILAGFELANHQIGWFFYDFIFCALNIGMFMYWIGQE